MSYVIKDYKKIFEILLRNSYDRLVHYARIHKHMENLESIRNLSWEDFLDSSKKAPLFTLEEGLNYFSKRE